MKPRALDLARAARARRGASLVLFVILVFALMAVAAVTVDVGSAQLTQMLMQDAVDTSSLEGQRWREFRTFSQQPIERRYKSSDIVRHVFDDDFDTTNGDAMNFGAGPAFETNSTATGGLDLGASSVYDPVLRYNRFNLQYGDFVSGLYDVSAPHEEAFDYTRTDFAPVPEDPDEPFVEAFLVRMRRTGLFNADDDIPSKSSKGPGMPLMFGRGSAVHGVDQETYDPRRDGLTVRATAIALSKPALSVGVTPVDGDGQAIDPDPTYSHTIPHIGVARVALLDSFWSDTLITDQPCLVVDLGVPSVPRLREVDAAGAPGAVVGFVVEDLLQVGREVVSTTSPAPDLDDAQRKGFVPIYRLIDGVKRVIGFGWAEMVEVNPADPQGCASSSGTVYRLAKRTSYLPVTGTCASLAWPVDPLSEPVWAEILQANRELFSNDRETGSALAPGIAR